MRKFIISDEDLRQIVTVQKETRTGQYICDCPLCGKPLHFYINKKTQMWDCKKCQRTGSIFKLLKELGKTYLIGEATIEQTDVLKSIRAQLEEELSQDEELKPLPVRRMPIGFKVGREGMYLRNRGISREECKRYNIGYTKLTPSMRGYVIIPIYDNNKIRGYIARYGNKQVPEDKLRYNNSRGTDFASLLFGYDEIVDGETSTVIIVEGVFDKFAVDRCLDLWSSPDIKCVCTFGKKISDIQIKKLLQKKVENVILSYDFDALKEIKKYGVELDHYFNTKVAVCMNKKDIDECTIDEAREVFMNPRSVWDFNLGTISKIRK